MKMSRKFFNLVIFLVALFFILLAATYSSAMTSINHISAIQLAGTLFCQTYAYVDTDIKPEEAAIFLDGLAKGSADDFDGFPRYLKVSPGRHLLEAKYPGFKTFKLKFEVFAGAVYEVDYKMIPGSEEEFLEKEKPKKEEILEKEKPETASPQDLGRLVLNISTTSKDVSGKPAEIFLDRKLIGTTDTNGKFETDYELIPGFYDLVIRKSDCFIHFEEIEIAPSQTLTRNIKLRAKNSEKER